MKSGAFYSEENYSPSESVGYLMRAAWQSLLKNIDMQMQTLDLTGMQWTPLLLIASGTCDTVAGCAKAGFSDAGAMTRMLDRLEAKGLLLRVRSEVDRRVVHLALTPSGSEVAKQIPALIVAVLNQHLRGFSEAEFVMLKDMLQRFTQNARDPLERS